MAEYFTPETLLQYIYNETDPALSKRIHLALKNDIQLLQTYQELIQGLELLDYTKQKIKKIQLAKVEIGK